VDDLAKLLENPTIANQPMAVKVVAVNLTLSAKNLTAEEPIADALRRDRALDAYQAMLAERVVNTEQRNSAKIQQISQEVEEYLKRKQAEMDALKAEVAEAKKQSVEFAIRREIEEKRMADLITPFLEGKPNPVTIGNTPEIKAPQ
jgi:tRNA uridine 5-carbamoylmethylation protein Kti12